MTEEVEQITKIIKQTGLTPTEQHLARLADHTFLDLWSWPNVFKKPGQELCDLLVVCGDDVLIFSDKCINWSDAPIETAWPRWYKKAISESAAQIRKAAAWLRSKPDSLFLDAKCQNLLPIALPPIERRRVHGICVAMGAEKAASDYFKDPDGTFLILPHLRGSDHVNFRQQLHRPFSIGDVDPAGPFIHVFNMLALDVVMAELDTITDFTRYLTARTKLIRSQSLLGAPSEAELLANYLLTTRQNGEHDFPTGADVQGGGPEVKVSYVQGEYAHLVRSPEYHRRRISNQPSYLWDKLIRLFTDSALNGRQYKVFDQVPTIEAAEKALRIMAREPRLQRRHLAGALDGALRACEEQNAARFARLLKSFDPATGEKIGYVFVVLRESDEMPLSDFRRMRASILQTYCLSALKDDSDLKLCVGIAVNAQSDRGASEELIAFEQQEWTPQLLGELGSAKEQFDISPAANLAPSRIATQLEFPPDPALEGMSRQQRRAFQRQSAKQRR